jgi:hypothetical protein
MGMPVSGGMPRSLMALETGTHSPVGKPDIE